MKMSGFVSSFLIALFSFVMAIGWVIPCQAQEARKSAAERRVILKNLIQKEKYLMVPGVYDAVSARLVEQAGFPVLYIGSYATAASQYGLPDDGMVNLTQMVGKARTVVNATNIPVIGDGENGFTFAANIWTTVQAFEQAGVSAIHIEDHEFGKHTDLPKVILPMEQMVGKIRAAVAARQDPNFLIIARTDIMTATGSPDDAVKRANAYLDAGADMVFPTGIPFDKMKELRGQIKGKVMTTHSTHRGKPAIEEELAGINIVLYYDFALSVAYKAVKSAVEKLKATKDISQLRDTLYNDAEFANFIGTPLFVEKVNKFMKK